MQVRNTPRKANLSSTAPGGVDTSKKSRLLHVEANLPPPTSLAPYVQRAAGSQGNVSHSMQVSATRMWQHTHMAIPPACMDSLTFAVRVVEDVVERTYADAHAIVVEQDRQLAVVAPPLHRQRWAWWAGNPKKEHPKIPHTKHAAWMAKFLMRPAMSAQSCRFKVTWLAPCPSRPLQVVLFRRSLWPGGGAAPETLPALRYCSPLICNSRHPRLAPCSPAHSNGTGFQARFRAHPAILQPSVVIYFSLPRGYRTVLMVRVNCFTVISVLICAYSEITLRCSRNVPR